MITLQPANLKAGNESAIGANGFLDVSYFALMRTHFDAEGSDPTSALTSSPTMPRSLASPPRTRRWSR